MLSFPSSRVRRADYRRAFDVACCRFTVETVWLGCLKNVFRTDGECRMFKNVARFGVLTAELKNIEALYDGTPRRRLRSRA